MIDLYYAPTPNGWKISIMLEECSLDYKVIPVNLGKGDQFKPEFKKISPFSKIPVIKDLESNEIIFESGAILIYLAEKSGKFYDQEKLAELMKRNGFSNIEYRNLSNGITAIHSGWKI